MSLWGVDELYVSNLPEDASESNLRDLFGMHGSVKDVVLNLTSKVQRPLGNAGAATTAAIVRSVAQERA